jgi:hypothetical protein
MKNKKFRKDMIATDFRNSFNKVMENTNWKQVDYYDVLKPYLKGLKKLYNQLIQTTDDTRSGEETYCYTSDSQIRERLEYISDRWYSAFRVKWLIDLIEDDPLRGIPLLKSDIGNGVCLPLTVSYSTINSPVNEYYVSEDGDDDNDGLTPEKPLKTVQQALEGKDDV